MNLPVPAYTTLALALCAYTTQGFMTEVKKEMDLSPEEGLRPLNADRDASGLGRPLPPYMSTINNLGLNNTPGMPNLAVSESPDPMHCRVKSCGVV